MSLRLSPLSYATLVLTSARSSCCFVQSLVQQLVFEEVWILHDGQMLVGARALDTREYREVGSWFNADTVPERQVNLIAFTVVLHIFLDIFDLMQVSIRHTLVLIIAAIMYMPLSA